VLASALIFLGGSEGAGAATLKANYQLQGNRVSAVAGAPELANLGKGNRFATETVDGNSRQVLAFPNGNGLSLATAGLVDPRNHSVVMTFRLANLSGYRRILDFTGGTADTGLYNLSGKIALYLKGNVASSRGAVLDNSYAQVTLTNAAASGDTQQTTVYVNGAEVASARTSEGFDLGPGVLRFFQDNTSGPATGEESAGAVACILVYDGTLTASEVGQVADDPTLCPAPRRVPGRAEASVEGEPRVLRGRGRSLLVDTGLDVRCPIGTQSCVASARVDVAPAGSKAVAARVKHLGVARFSVPAGAGGRVGVRLSRRGAEALREAGSLRVRTSVEIAVPGGRKARARQTGRIEAPRAPRFKAGTYTGTTSQDLPIVVTVGRTAIRSVYFSWRTRCADGKTHTNTIFLRGDRVRQGRFSFGGKLDSGGSVRVSGRIRGARASGTLARSGPSSFGAACTVGMIRWHARFSGVEIETSR
jgi:hypothetical protein